MKSGPLEPSVRDPEQPAPRMINLRLTTRRSFWLPTARGWAVLAILFLASALLLLRPLGSFLAPNAPVQAQVLVVEGWVGDATMRDAMDEFKRDGYQLLITSGGADPMLERFHFKTFAEFAAANLAAMGFDTNRLVAAPPGKVIKDRTYASALAVKAWLETKGPPSPQPSPPGEGEPGVKAWRETNGPLRALNVYTVGPHARRTRLLFQKAFGPAIHVGVFSHPDPRFDQHRWWASMDGFADVLGEAIAYGYARLLFHP